MKAPKILTLSMMAAAALLAFSCINEDLSDCGKDYRIDYLVKLQTSLEVNITEELNKSDEQAIANMLHDALADIYTEHAHDVDISFFSANALEHHERHIMDGTSSSFTIYLPVNDYRNLAVANSEWEPTVVLEGTDSDATFTMRQLSADTVSSHSAALFTSRLSMNVIDRNQVFHATLHMQNCVSALVIDHKGHNPDAVWGYVEGMASGFAVSDSTYHFDAEPLPIRTTPLFDGNRHSALYSVHFPSHQTMDRGAAEDALWRFHCFVTDNGTTTKSTLHISEPIEAGEMKIIKVVIGDGGEIVSDAPNVAVSVQLDWKPGGTFNPEL